jgi:transposase
MRGGKGGVISMYQWHQVKVLRAKGVSIKKIARQLKLSKNTVRKYLRSSDPPTFHAREYEKLLDGYQEAIRAMVDKGFIGTRIFNELVAMGYPGSLATVHRYLKEIKQQEAIQEKVTTRVETPPGKQMQYDWKEWKIAVGDTKIKSYIHKVVLSYSRKKYYTYSLEITTQDVIRAIEGAIVFFGGVAPELIIDNPKQMVIAHGKDGVIRYNDAFLRFCGLYGIEPNPCEPYRARTKGKVERPFFYLEQHLLKGLELQELFEFDGVLKAFMEKYNARPHSTLKESPHERFLREKDSLGPIPFVEPAVLYDREIRKVSNDGYLSWKGRLYPIPMPYCLKNVMAEEVFGRTLRVYNLSGEIISEQAIRHFDRGQRPEHPEHEKINQAYRAKKEAKRSQLVRQFTDTFGDISHIYVEGLKKTVTANIYWHLQEILNYTALYPVSAISEVLLECIGLGAYHKNSVKKLLGEKELAQPCLEVSGVLPVAPLVNITRPLADYRVEVTHA